MLCTCCTVYANTHTPVLPHLLPCALPPFLYLFPPSLPLPPSLPPSLPSPLTISRMLRAHFWCEMQKGAEHVSRSSFPVRWKWICSRIFSCRREGEERVNQEGGEREYRQEIPASSDMKKLMIYNVKCTCTYSVHVQYTCMCNSSTHSN